ncbi:hypothetical protein P3G30_RS12525, partial [Escherichia coli]
VSQSTEENARQIAQVRQYVDDKGSEITSTTDKKLEDQSATIQQIQQVQSDTNDELCNQVNHLIPTRVLVKGGEITCKMLK